MSDTTTKMNPEIKAKWVERLRSGKLKQTNGKLKSANESFCCLGVLCDIYMKENKRHWTPIKEGEKTIAMSVRDKVSGEFESSFLPDLVMSWSNLKEQDPVVKVTADDMNEKAREAYKYELESHGYVVRCLSELNDEDKLNFNQIANIIEREL